MRRSTLLSVAPHPSHSDDEMKRSPNLLATVEENVETGVLQGC
ncbi:hypothetical protein V6Z12_D10G144300 [Gossypium hirsutum]